MPMTPIMRMRLDRIAEMIDGDGSLPEVEEIVRGRSDVAAIVIGPHHDSLAYVLQKISRDLRAVAEELRAMDGDANF